MIGQGLASFSLIAAVQFQIEVAPYVFKVVLRIRLVCLMNWPNLELQRLGTTTSTPGEASLASLPFFWPFLKSQAWQIGPF